MQKKNKHYIIIGFITIGIVAVVFIMLRTVFDIKKISGSIMQERISLEKRYKRGQIINKIKKRIKELNEEVGKNFNIFINLEKNEEIELIQALETIAQNNNLALTKEFNIDKKKNTLLLNLKLNGDFVNIFKFINQLEQSRYYIDINGFSIQNNARTVKDGAGFGQVSAQFSATTYLLPTNK